MIDCRDVRQARQSARRTTKQVRTCDPAEHRHGLCAGFWSIGSAKL